MKAALLGIVVLLAVGVLGASPATAANAPKPVVISRSGSKVVVIHVARKQPFELTASNSAF